MEQEKIIFATGNEDKMKEIREIMSDIGDRIFSLKEAGIEADIEENGATFEENAIIKARAICRLTGQIVLADDSGLEVDYMNKAPGVYSARYLGEDTSYSIKNQTIIKNLENAKARGEIEGLIAYEEKGDNGFGYDPIFYVPDYNMTTAQMDSEQKNNISHRGKALRLMKEKLKYEGIDC